MAKVERFAKDRPIRVCDVCGGFDDHPRHQFGAGANTFPVNTDHLLAAASLTGVTEEERKQLLQEIADTTVQQRHMHCCREAGCPDGTCNTLPDLRGEELLAHIVGNGA